MQFNNKRKELLIPAANLTRAWLSLIKGLTTLTDREVDVLEVMITKRQDLLHSGVKQPYLSQLLFSTESRKEYCDQLKITEYNLTNLISSLRKKQAIFKNLQGVEDIFGRLLPSEEVLIKFLPQHDKGTGDS